MADLPNDDDARDRRVNQVIANYLEAIERGETPDPSACVAAHPEIARELLPFFSDRAEFPSATGTRCL